MRLSRALPGLDQIRRRIGPETGFASTPGQKFEIVRIDQGEDRLKRKARHNEGLVKLLLACPVKGWFEPLGRSELIVSPASAGLRQERGLVGGSLPPSQAPGAPPQKR